MKSVPVVHIKIIQSRQHRVHACDYCHASFDSTAALTHHEAKQHADIHVQLVFVCPTCHVCLLSHSDLLYHLRDLHCQVVTTVDEEVMLCDCCGFTFPDEPSLSVHLTHIHHTHPYYCPPPQLTLTDLASMGMGQKDATTIFQVTEVTIDTRPSNKVISGQRVSCHFKPLGKKLDSRDISSKKWDSRDIANHIYNPPSKAGTISSRRLSKVTSDENTFVHIIPLNTEIEDCNNVSYVSRRKRPRDKEILALQKKNNRVSHDEYSTGKISHASLETEDWDLVLEIFNPKHYETQNRKERIFDRNKPVSRVESINWDLQINADKCDCYFQRHTLQNCTKIFKNKEIDINKLTDLEVTVVNTSDSINKYSSNYENTCREDSCVEIYEKDSCVEIEGREKRKSCIEKDKESFVERVEDLYMDRDDDLCVDTEEKESCSERDENSRMGRDSGSCVDREEGLYEERKEDARMDGNDLCAEREGESYMDKEEADLSIEREKEESYMVKERDSYAETEEESCMEIQKESHIGREGESCVETEGEESYMDTEEVELIMEREKEESCMNNGASCVDGEKELCLEQEQDSCVEMIVLCCEGEESDGEITLTVESSEEIVWGGDVVSRVLSSSGLISRPSGETEIVDRKRAYECTMVSSRKNTCEYMVIEKSDRLVHEVETFNRLGKVVDSNLHGEVLEFVVGENFEVEKMEKEGEKLLVNKPIIEKKVMNIVEHDIMAKSNVSSTENVQVERKGSSEYSRNKNRISSNKPSSSKQLRVNANKKAKNTQSQKFNTGFAKMSKCDLGFYDKGYDNGISEVTIQNNGEQNINITKETENYGKEYAKPNCSQELSVIELKDEINTNMTFEIVEKSVYEQLVTEDNPDGQPSKYLSRESQFGTLSSNQEVTFELVETESATGTTEIPEQTNSHPSREFRHGILSDGQEIAFEIVDRELTTTEIPDGRAERKIRRAVLSDGQEITFEILGKELATTENPAGQPDSHMSKCGSLAESQDCEGVIMISCGEGDTIADVVLPPNISCGGGLNTAHTSNQGLGVFSEGAHQVGLPLKRKACRVCGTVFKTLGELSGHESSVHGVSVSCTQCGTTFTSRHALQTHMLRKHTHGPGFSCQDCGKVFRSRGNLWSHRLTHLGPEERRHQCHICPQKFPTRPKLSVHLQTHQKQKRYQCGECEKSFVYQALLMRHFKKHLPNNHSPGPGEESSVYVVMEEQQTSG